MAKQKKKRMELRHGDNELSINFDDLRNAVLVLRAINHELRRQIIQLLQSKDRLTVTDIYIALRIEQSVASQHLAILRKAGIVRPEREGKFIYYSIERERLALINQLITDLKE